MKTLLLILLFNIYPIGAPSPVVTDGTTVQQELKNTNEKTAQCPKCGKTCYVIWGKLYDRTDRGGYIDHNCPAQVPIGSPFYLLFPLAFYVAYRRKR